VKNRKDFEDALEKAFKIRMERLRLVYETLHTWCDHRLLGSGEGLKSSILLGSYSDACHHFAQSYFEERRAIFELHAFANFDFHPIKKEGG